VGTGKSAGNPAPQGLARLAGRDMLRTDQPVAITVATDRKQMWVAVSRSDG
jgi:hypothetical protein